MRKENKFVKFLPFIIIIMIVLIVIFAIISIAKALISQKAPTEQRSFYESAKTELLTTDDSRAVSMLVRGEIVGNEDFKSHRITVSPSQRKIEVYKGYSQQTIFSKSFSNTPKAYEEFVYALERANLVKGVPFEVEADNTRGICAEGTVYEFDLLVSNQSIDHLWSSTCKGSKGSLVANSDQIQRLFLRQIPNAEKLIRSARSK